MRRLSRSAIFKRLEALSVKTKADRPKTSTSLGEARAKVAALDLVAWGRKYLPAFFTSASPDEHVELLRALAGGTQTRGMREAVVGSRGTAKSVCVSLIYVLACAVHGAEPFILLLSETADQANQLLEAVKSELEDNPRLADDYPEACGRGPTWRVNKVVTANGVVIESAGSGKRLRGRRKKQARPTLVIGDDLEGDDHASSGPMRETSARWWDSTIMKIGDGTTNFVVVANALHRDSLAMTLQRRPSWKARTWRSIAAMPERMDLWAQWEAVYLDPRQGAVEAADAFYRGHKAEMERGAKVFWRDRDGEDLPALMKMRAENRSSFEAEKQCNPINPALCEWGDSYFESLVWFTRWPKDLQVKTIAVDPSKGKDAKRGDYSAIVHLGRDRAGQMWVRADLKRRDTRKIVEDAVRAHIEFRPDAAVCEGNSFQELLAEDMGQEAERQGQVADFHPIDNTVKKVVRIRRLTPYLSHGKFNFYDDAGTRLLVDQLREFPIGSHDDGPDALEMALRAAIDTFNTNAHVGGSNSSVAFDVD